MAGKTKDIIYKKKKWVSWIVKYYPYIHFWNVAKLFKSFHNYNDYQEKIVKCPLVYIFPMHDMGTTTLLKLMK